jgi:alkanesulfonate monooxygenase SsuD/methylene tetrahydromethanopterin reductase-like flavin-dependent oxidoreductase (luciferase family)
VNAVKFGIFINTPSVQEAVEQAVSAEAGGFYSASVNDHFYSPLGSPETPQIECFTALTAMAMATSSIRLAPCVASSSFRSPALLGKICASIDTLSSGRFICGLGAGWQDKEYINHGYLFPRLSERLEQLDETIQILKAMTSSNPSYTGKHFQINDAFNNPRPINGTIPLMLGGSGTGLLKIAAREANILNIIPPTGHGKDFINDPVATIKFDMSVLKKRIAVLHELMAAEGRKPEEVELGGLALLGLSRKKDDQSLKDLASHLGFGDYASAQAAPVTLLGTAQEVRKELHKRISETGVTYYIFVMANPETQEIFEKDVLPDFS